jgi:long-chain acyl-CoA synthetase
MDKTNGLPAQEKVHGLMINADLSNGPFYIDGLDTTPKLFRKRCQDYGPRTAHQEKILGIWQSHSWDDFFTRAKHIGLGLVSLGLKPGEVVSVLSEDNKEWIYTDMAVQSVGAICSGVYTTDSAAQLEYLINDSDSRFLLVENDEQLDKFLQVREQMPGLTKVIIIDRDGLHGFSDPQVMFLDELYALGAAYDAANPQAFDASIDATQPEDTAILVYTSGTTGKPKGAMISHANLIYSISAALRDASVFDTDNQLCFLPLCHVLERLFSVNMSIAAASKVSFAESPETVFDNLQEVSPQTFVAVPRLWEKIYSQVAIRINDATGLQKWAYAQALRAGATRAEHLANGRPLPLSSRLAYRFWDVVLLQNLRRMIGLNSVRRGNSGAAPISPDLLKWYHSIGVPLLEGYGMTESAGIISLNGESANAIGTVGQALPGSQIRISAEGEVQYTAGNVFQGYWKNPEKTAETFTSDGWLRTGDLGTLDNQGFLTITGRLKDIIITAGGKNITPAEIENKLKFSPYISDVVVIGDRRKYLTCLVMIDQENVEKFAQDRRVPFSNYASLCAAQAVQDLIRETVDSVNKDLARVEQIKDFRLIDVLLTADDDELTPTMKLKRSFVESKHSALINQMY